MQHDNFRRIRYCGNQKMHNFRVPSHRHIILNSQTLFITDPDITDFVYKGQNLAAYNCEFSEMLRHKEDFTVRKLFNIENNPNIKNLYVNTLCVFRVLAM
jgi:hypothetical protein